MMVRSILDQFLGEGLARRAVVQARMRETWHLVSLSPEEKIEVLEHLSNRVRHGRYEIRIRVR
jgi:hypothetical protein